MPVINPEHLLAQAGQLSAAPAAGAPRQADLRRAISASYYAVFHRTMTAIADALIGNTKRATPEYALAYRAASHAALKQLCVDLQKSTPPARFAGYVPLGGLGADFVAYAAALVDLQEKRHTADYDPVSKASLVDAKVAIKTAETAIVRLNGVPRAAVLTFASLLVFKARD